MTEPKRPARAPLPATARERMEQRYLVYKEANPGVSYAEWSVIAQLKSLANGGNHATLGPRLRKYSRWWDAGANTFQRYLRWFPITPGSRVADYGCGSLRVGGHFIRHLQPGHYFGLDIAAGFMDMGKELIGAELMAEKRPRFDVIGDASVAEAADWGADIVYSSAVSYHVHPNEAAAYFANLAKIAGKPGTLLFFDASVSDGPVDDLQLSMPLDYFRKALGPLDFVTFHEIEKVAAHNQIIGILEFRRPEKVVASS